MVVYYNYSCIHAAIRDGFVSAIKIPRRAITIVRGWYLAIIDFETTEVANQAVFRFFITSPWRREWHWWASVSGRNWQRSANNLDSEYRMSTCREWFCFLFIRLTSHIFDALSIGCRFGHRFLERVLQTSPSIHLGFGCVSFGSQWRWVIIIG